MAKSSKRGAQQRRGMGSFFTGMLPGVRMALEPYVHQLRAGMSSIREAAAAQEQSKRKVPDDE